MRTRAVERAVERAVGEPLGQERRTGARPGGGSDGLSQPLLDVAASGGGGGGGGGGDQDHAVCEGSASEGSASEGSASGGSVAATGRAETGPAAAQRLPCCPAASLSLPPQRPLTLQGIEIGRGCLTALPYPLILLHTVIWLNLPTYLPHPGVAAGELVVLVGPVGCGKVLANGSMTAL